MKRESFKSRLGFILVSAGCAIGIGNVWRFPYVAGNSGGGFFVFIYLFFLAIMGLPIMTMEFAVGRASQKSAVCSYQVLEKPGQKWHLHGWLAMAGNYLLMMFYTTVSGWMLHYFYMEVRGGFSGKDSKGVTQVFYEMLESPETMTFWMVVVVILGFFICAQGLQNGVERITKYMMSALLVIMVVLAVRSATLPGASEGLAFYLLPSWSKMQEIGVGNVIVSAMNQAFFTLSLGVAAMEIFGGNFDEIIIGGAPFNAEVEAFLKQIGFPYTIAYGMTECGPLLSYDDWSTFKQGSCGKAIERVQLRIDSPDQQQIVGEILAKGDCVMSGYYKNPEATQAALDKEGWLHTGDMGIIDADGYLFIRGRCKNMILSSNGQNIYPEEIEDRLNNMPYVSESIVIEKDNKLIALIYPDFDTVNADHVSDEKLAEAMTDNLKELNQQLPAYSQLSSYKLYNEEFEKTPKRSIKRFLYQ